MGASEDQIREALIGEVLGELSLLRRDVKDLSLQLQATGRQFKDDGELTLLRFTSRYEQFLKDFHASSLDVLAEAARFSEARDQLLGEISLRQYDEANGRVRGLLRDVLRQDGRGAGVSRTELAIWTTCAAFGAAALSVGAIAALHLLGA